MQAHAEGDPPAAGGITAAQLAEAIEQINTRHLVTSPEASPAATASAAVRSLDTAGGDAVVDADLAGSLTGEAASVDAMAARLEAGGGVSVTDVEVDVDAEKVEDGVRFVTLHIKRTLQDGQVWESLTPYAVIDEDDAGLRAGQVFAVDRDAVEEGRVPDDLRDFRSVTATDDSRLEADSRSGKPTPGPGDGAPDVGDGDGSGDGPGEELPGGPGSEAGVPASTERPVEPVDPDPDTAGPTPAQRSAVGSQTTGATASTRAVALALSAADRNKVRDYALRYAMRPNPAYHVWSQDCTNFVSQAMRAGGWSFDLGWYRGDGNWWYTGNPGIKASWTWAGAENWYKFARNESKRVTAWTNVYQLRVGDILQYKQAPSAVMNHSMVTTGHSGGVPLLSYHSGPEINKPFTSISQSGKTWFAHKV